MELSSSARKFPRSRPLIECAQCGDRLYVPEWTEYRDGGRISHLWSLRSLRHVVRNRRSLRRGIELGEKPSREGKVRSRPKAHAPSPNEKYTGDSVKPAPCSRLARNRNRRLRVRIIPAHSIACRRIAHAKIGNVETAGLAHRPQGSAQGPPSYRRNLNKNWSARRRAHLASAGARQHADRRHRPQARPHRNGPCAARPSARASRCGRPTARPTIAAPAAAASGAVL